MPFDLRLTDGDIVIDPFDIQLNEVGLEAVAQRIAITLRAFKGEYFLNTEFGTPWYQTVLRKGVSKNLIDGQLRSVITSVEGVLQLIEYSSEISTVARLLTVNFKARVDDGVLDVAFGSSGVVISTGDRILLESGDALLLEDGVSFLLQE